MKISWVSCWTRRRGTWRTSTPSSSDTGASSSSTLRLALLRHADLFWQIYSKEVKKLFIFMVSWDNMWPMFAREKKSVIIFRKSLLLKNAVCFWHITYILYWQKAYYKICLFLSCKPFLNWLYYYIIIIIIIFVLIRDKLAAHNSSVSLKTEIIFGNLGKRI